MKKLPLTRLTRLTRLAVVALLCACADPQQSLPIGKGVPVQPDVAALAFTPERADGHVARSVRIAVHLGRPLSPDAARPGRVVLIAGGASDGEIDRIAHGKATAALRDREVPMVTWGGPSGSMIDTIWVQPSRPLPSGRATLIVLFDRRAPFVHDLDVADEGEPAVRVWPIAFEAAIDGEPWTYCGSTRPPDGLPSAIVLAPSTATAHVRRRDDSPCVDVVADGALDAGSFLPPPSLGEWALDPAPIDVTTGPTPTLDDAPCGAGDLSLGPICAQVDDDRVILVGNAASSTLVLGNFGDRRVVAPLQPFGRAVIRGLTPNTPLDVSIVVRDHAAEQRREAHGRTRAPHRHLVVNETLAHPPSTSPQQRFVELINAGDRPASLAGVHLVDGGRSIALPPKMLSPGELVLITPSGFSDGFGGDVPPTNGITRITVDALRLTSDVSLVDIEGATLSRFPGTTSTRTASHGRRSPDSPDDAPDAFGFDATGKATPGWANEVEE